MTYLDESGYIYTSEPCTQKCKKDEILHHFIILILKEFNAYIDDDKYYKNIIEEKSDLICGITFLLQFVGLFNNCTFYVTNGKIRSDNIHKNMLSIHQHCPSDISKIYLSDKVVDAIQLLRKTIGNSPYALPTVMPWDEKRSAVIRDQSWLENTSKVVFSIVNHCDKIITKYYSNDYYDAAHRVINMKESELQNNTSSTKLANMILYIAERSFVDPTFNITKMRRTCWLSDSFMFTKYGRYMTNPAYKKGENDDIYSHTFDSTVKSMTHDKTIAISCQIVANQSSNRIVALKSADISKFSPEERSIIDNAMLYVTTQSS